MSSKNGLGKVSMQTSDYGIAAIKKFEGWRPLPYKDIIGKTTIGYGHLVQPGEVFGIITPVEGNTILANDLKHVENAINHLVVAKIEQWEFDAFASFIFNLGVANFASSTLLRKFNAGDKDGCANEFVRWDHAGQQEVAALKTRRLAEKAIFTDGVYP